MGSFTWVSPDGRSGIEAVKAFIQDVDDTVKSGGTRENVAQKWGITSQQVSNRIQYLERSGYKLNNFTHQRGLRRNQPADALKPARSGNWKSSDIDPQDVIDLLAKHGGDIAKAAPEMGLTYHELYNLKKKIIAHLTAKLEAAQDDDSVLDDMKISTAVRGRPSLAGKRDPTAEQFAEIWNKCDSRAEALQAIMDAFPDVPLRQVKWLSWNYGPSGKKPIPGLKQFDARRGRWNIVTKPVEQSKRSAYQDFLLGQDSDEESDEEPLEKAIAEPEPEISAVPDQEIEAELEDDDDQVHLSDVELEFMGIWNEAESKEAAVRALKAADFSSPAIKELHARLKVDGYLKKF